MRPWLGPSRACLATAAPAWHETVSADVTAVSHGDGLTDRSLHPTELNVCDNSVVALPEESLLEKERRATPWSSLPRLFRRVRRQQAVVCNPWPAEDPWPAQARMNIHMPITTFSDSVFGLVARDIRLCARVPLLRR